METTCPPSPRPVSRRTRSQAAPGWTVQEMLTLANEVAAVEEDCRRALSSYQRWAIVAENCSVILGGAPRNANQCRRQWGSIVADYGRIRAWEEKNGSYWSLDEKERRAAGLPMDFDRDVFVAIALSRPTLEGCSLSEPEPQGVQPGREGDADVSAATEISGSKKKKTMEAKSRPARTLEDVACKLQENAFRIHAIVKGELTKDDAAEDNSLPVDLKNPSPAYIESKRLQADELIKALGDLVCGLHHFGELAGADRRRDGT